MYHYISALNFAIQSSNVQDNLLSTFVLKSNEILWIIFKIEELINIEFISSMKDEIYFKSDLNVNLDLVLSHVNAWQIYVYTSYLVFLNMYDFNKHEKITLIMFTAAVHSWAYNSNYKLNCSKNNTLVHIIY